MSVDLEIHCCKFYNQDIQVQRTYFLVIPRDDTISIEVQLDQSAEINEETIKPWTNQPWYHHCVVKKISHDRTQEQITRVQEKSIQKVVDKVGKKR